MNALKNNIIVAYYSDLIYIIIINIIIIITIIITIYIII